MDIKRKWIRDIMSVVFTIVYMLFPDAADEKVRRFRLNASIDSIRASWQKATNPYFYMITMFDRGYLGIRKNLSIPAPSVKFPSAFPLQPKGNIKARLYFHGTSKQLRDCTSLIFHIPGGGFVAMDPEHHDDYVSNWARQTKLPIISINYGKAPEHPYPWALEECFEAYKSIDESNAKVLGIECPEPIKILVVGDSAGGNLGVGVMLKCLDTPVDAPRSPHALVFMYPALSLDLECWMKPSYLSILRTQSHLDLSDEYLKSKLVMQRNHPLHVSEG
jgi:acetyl esterase/lipase